MLRTFLSTEGGWIINKDKEVSKNIFSSPHPIHWNMNNPINTGARNAHWLSLVLGPSDNDDTK